MYVYLPIIIIIIIYLLMSQLQTFYECVHVLLNITHFHLKTFLIHDKCTGANANSAIFLCYSWQPCAEPWHLADRPSLLSLLIKAALSAIKADCFLDDWIIASHRRLSTDNVSTLTNISKTNPRDGFIRNIFTKCSRI